MLRDVTAPVVNTGPTKAFRKAPGRAAGVYYLTETCE